MQMSVEMVQSTPQTEHYINDKMRSACLADQEYPARRQRTIYKVAKKHHPLSARIF